VASMKQSSILQGVAQKGRVLQVVSVTKTNRYTVTLEGGSTDTSDVPGLTATITPGSTSNKIMVFVSIVLGGGNRMRDGFVLRRNSSDIFLGDTGLTERITSGYTFSVTVEGSIGQNFMGLDTPATTSPLTYAIRLSNGAAGSKLVGVNQLQNAVTAGAVSTITLMEVAG